MPNLRVSNGLTGRHVLVHGHRYIQGGFPSLDVSTMSFVDVRDQGLETDIWRQSRWKT
jgi:hypothetical protein